MKLSELRRMPIWELTRHQYFLTITTKTWVDTWPAYRIEGRPKQVHPYQRAWDIVGYDKELGQAYITMRQILRSNDLKILTPYLFVEYEPFWKKFFRENPAIVATSLEREVIRTQRTNSRLTAPATLL